MASDRIWPKRQHSHTEAMTAMPTELWKLPVPATALVKGPEFNVLAKRQCEISFHIEGNGTELIKISLLFDGVEAFKCTYLTSSSAEMFKAAYAKLVRLGAAPWLSELLKTKGGSRIKS